MRYGKPFLKDDYVTIEKAHELMLQLQLRYLLDQVEARYKAIWTSEPSKDGYFWYRYDETSFGPMMQPDGYDGYDKAFTSEGQNGTGAVAYLTQLHPDAILTTSCQTSSMRAKTRLTLPKKGVVSMGVFQRMAQNHWKKYLPNLTAALMKEGTFDQETEAAAQMAKEELANLVNRGAQMEAAKEIVLKEYILLPPETTE